MPEIWPEPPVMGSRMTGASMILPSRMMAKSLPTLAVVTSPNSRAPTELREKLTTHWPLCGSVEAWALLRSAPSTATEENTSMLCCGLPAMGSCVSPRGAMAPGVALESTIWKVMCAVVPMRVFTRSGSETPGSWTTISSVPWRAMVGLSTPEPSIRRWMMVMDCATAWASRAMRVWCGMLMVMLPSGAWAMATLGELALGA